MSQNADKSKETNSPPKPKRGRKPENVSKNMDFTGQDPVMRVRMARMLQRRRATEERTAMVNIGVGRQELSQMTTDELLIYAQIIKETLSKYPRGSVIDR
ncbi:2871_t:CDS:2 [Paraglomus occultum]|uniref:2871_t:CDS:1 n=1 Tax=Paraglomus occultum TaxID=144539 RepID=A0A9N8WAG8_9GLOM|nr:2871_t:CDS:2 [Paraglomus occultum]